MRTKNGNGKTLLQVAMETPTRAGAKAFTEEEIELASAWAERRINTTQVRKTLGVLNTSAYVFLANALASQRRQFQSNADIS